jgi:hypothetical protein
MTGYFQQPMSLRQVEIFKAIALLGLPGEKTVIACTGDVYVYLEKPAYILEKTFIRESEDLHTNFTLTETKPLITEYLVKQGVENNDHALLKAMEEGTHLQESEEMLEKMTANVRELTRRMDGLAKDIFGPNVLTGTEVLKALVVGRKAAREHLYIRDDGKVAGTPISE